MPAQISPEALPFRRQALDAVGVMFARAIEHGADKPSIEDKKNLIEPDPLRNNGTLQNCEFGMMLLLAREWLGEELSAVAPPAPAEQAVLALVQQTAGRLLNPLNSDQGGGGGLRTFFTGEPYSKRRNGKFAANLDAAMISVAFLMLAVARYNDSLAKLPIETELELPEWVKNLRDAALFVVADGLRYAVACKVTSKGQFQGFSCDPDSQRERPEDGMLTRDDRLFYTWTACETINDLKQWRETYLGAKTPLSAALPPQAVADIQSLADQLEVNLDEAAAWCKSEFFEEFSRLDIKEPKSLVRDIEKLKGKKPSAAQEAEVAELKACVQHVYLISQYAAIRSLQPGAVDMQEVRVILDKLDNLVSRSIIGTGLDDAEDNDLFKTLTREYSIGKSSGIYSDDAWYPLVVRSLAGLLARTLVDIGQRASAAELPALKELVASFTRSLDGHVKNLVSRRPKGGENGIDVKLWSFAADQPYVLYATQRTIFALMKYEEFLVEVAKPIVWKPEPSPNRDPVSVVTQRLAEHFRPMVAELIDQLGMVVADRAQVQLPSEPWAAEVISRWLTALAHDFPKVVITLEQRANHLIHGRDVFESAPLKAPQNTQLLKAGEIHLKRILELGPTGEKLRNVPAAMPAGQKTKAVTIILLEHLFDECFKLPELLESKKRPELFELIELLDRKAAEVGQS